MHKFLLHDINFKKSVKKQLPVCSMNRKLLLKNLSLPCVASCGWLYRKRTGQNFLPPDGFTLTGQGRKFIALLFPEIQCQKAYWRQTKMYSLPHPLHHVFRSLLLHFRIKCVPQAVTEQIKSQDNQADQNRRADHAVRIGINASQRFRGQGAEARHRCRNADSKEA